MAIQSVQGGNMLYLLRTVSMQLKQFIVIIMENDDDDDWVKKCMEYEVEGPRPRGRPKRTWREVVREDSSM